MGRRTNVVKFPNPNKRGEPAGTAIPLTLEQLIQAKNDRIPPPRAAFSGSCEWPKVGLSLAAW